MAAALKLGGVLLAATWMIIACSGGSEEQGRIQVTPAQVAGFYELKLDKGSERLELKVDGTYVQDTIWESGPFHHTGQWRVVSHFLDGSEVLLINAAVASPATPEDKTPHLQFGSLPMHVHNRAGKVALARNEVADWYYERLH